MPTVYAYVRVSTERQATEGSSLDAQAHALEQFYRQQYEPKGFAWGKVYADPAESGPAPFRSRPGGKRVCDLVQSGDVVVVVRGDRAFRNVLDMLSTVKWWTDTGVSYRDTTHDFNTATAAGRLVMTMFGAFAEFESSVLRERQALAVAEMRRQGVPFGAPPFGFRAAGKGKKRRMVPNPVERELGRFMVEMHDAGYSHEKIALEMKARRLYYRNRTLGDDGVQRLLVKERALRAAEAAA